MFICEPAICQMYLTPVFKVLTTDHSLIRLVLCRPVSWNHNLCFLIKLNPVIAV